jgi:hypothetical protein
VLRSAAVVGYEFDVDLLADVLGTDVDDVLDALDTAQAANLVIEIGVDRHRFAHALVRETLHGELSSSRRARQHRKVAEALEARYADNVDSVIAELATHWAEASAGGDPTRAIELAVRAGELADERGAVENAVGWFERALDLIDDESLVTPDARRVLVRLADAQISASDTALGRANTLRAADAAIGVGDVDLACAALEVTPRGSFASGDPADPERVAMLRRALELDGLSTLQRASLLGELAIELIFERDIAGRRAVLDEQAGLLANLPIEQRAWLIRSPGSFRYADFGYDEMRERAEWMRALPRESVRPWEYVQSRLALVWLCLSTHDGEGADAALASATTAVAGVEVSRRTAFTAMAAAQCANVAGDIAEAERLAADAVAMMLEVGVPEARNYWVTSSLHNARERGALGDLAGFSHEVARADHPAGAAVAISAYLRHLQGDSVTEELDRLDGEEFADDAGRSIVIAYWAEIVASLRDEARCRRFIAEIEPLTGVHVGTGGMCFGAADRLLALLHDALGDSDPADAYVTRAVEQHHRLRSPTWVARTELDWAGSLIARDRLDDAREHLAAAEVAIGDKDLADSKRRLAALSLRC